MAPWPGFDTIFGRVNLSKYRFYIAKRQKECYNTLENRIYGSLQVPARNAWVKRERSENLRQDRCCEVELQINTTGENREGVCGVEAESEDLPVMQ